MNAKNLSDRLRTVASFVEPGAVLADIGSDHAYLPCWLMRNGIIEKAVAGEVVKGPFDSACRNVEKEGLSGQITVRMADGLKAIESQDGVDTVTIAGMGGSLIASILQADSDRLAKVKRLILQPNIHSVAIREWGAAHGWAVIDEAILKEDGKLYEIIVLERGSRPCSPEELLMGPVLIREKTEDFLEKWNGEAKQIDRILSNLPPAPHSAETHEKKAQLTAMKELIERVLAR